ncbi:MAG: DUF4386 domain-containing protein [Candidatus Odinarchaeota archaeon]
MESDRWYARSAGVFFLTAQIAGILSSVILLPIQDAPDYLAQFSANETQVLLGALFEFIMAAAAPGIAISLYPILKRQNEGMALWSVGFRIIEGALFMIGVFGILSLVPVSQEFVQAGSPSGSYFQTLGGILLAGPAWVIGGIAFCLAALVYYYVFYQSELVPRWLSVFGLIAITMGLAANLLLFFSIGIPFEFSFLLQIPTLVQEVVFAVWLIVKGFDSPANATGST